MGSDGLCLTLFSIQSPIKATSKGTLSGDRISNADAANTDLKTVSHW